MSLEESKALRRWREGEPQGFDEIYALASPSLAAFCRFLARDEASASDLFQETWRQAIERISSYRQERSFKAWLTTLAYHLWIDQHRRGGVERAALEERLRGASEEALPEAEDDPALREILDRLPPEQREAVLLHDLQGLTIRETARLLGVGHSTLHERLARAHEALARAMKPK